MEKSLYKFNILIQGISVHAVGVFAPNVFLKAIGSAEEFGVAEFKYKIENRVILKLLLSATLRLCVR